MVVSRDSHCGLDCGREETKLGRGEDTSGAGSQEAREWRRGSVMRIREKPVCDGEKMCFYTGRKEGTRQKHSKLGHGVSASGVARLERRTSLLSILSSKVPLPVRVLPEMLCAEFRSLVFESTSSLLLTDGRNMAHFARPHVVHVDHGRPTPSGP